MCLLLLLGRVLEGVAAVDASEVPAELERHEEGAESQGEGVGRVAWVKLAHTQDQEVGGHGVHRGPDDVHIGGGEAGGT